VAAFYRLLSEADPAGAERSSQRQPTTTTAKKHAASPRSARPRSRAREASSGTSSNGATAPAVPAVAAPASPVAPTNVRLGPMGGITVNIELQIPATADAKFFEQFFSSMRKHLLDENE
jgi:hypothetical protein